MHAIRVLREDHERIRTLLDKLSGDGRDPRLLDLLEKELSVHTRAEDYVFLPQVEDAIKDSRRTAREFSENCADALAGASRTVAAAYENHREVRAVLARGRARDGVEKLAEELVRLVGRQVDLEESLYPQAEKVLEEEDFERMGDQIEHCKWQVRGLAQARLASSSGFKPSGTTTRED